MRILQAEKLSKNFGGLAAVSQVDLNVNRGELLGLIGPNGAGKTTLFNILSGAVTGGTGSIRFKEQLISGFKPHQICRLGIARTFQSVKIFPNMSVMQNVLVGALFGAGGKISSSSAADAAMQAIDFAGLAPLMHKPVRDITLVSQKRLEVARALATKPELLLLDEMMAGLNPTELEEAMTLVKKIRDSGVTVVMIEHVMKAIMSMCDRIVVLNHGKKIAEGTPQEIAADKTVIEVYLGEC